MTAKVTTIRKSRKPTACENCGAALPKGSTYRYISFFRQPQKNRCMDKRCDFKPYELNTGKGARIDEAVCEAEDAIDSAESFADLQAALSECAGVANEVRDEYQDASDNWAGGVNYDFAEKADLCGGFADECEGFSPSGETDEETVRNEAIEPLTMNEGETEADFEKRKKEVADEAWAQALEDLKEEARDVLSNWEGV